MNGISGFQAGCGKQCRARPARKAQSKVQGSKFRKLRTQNFRPRTSRHAYRFLHEQRHRFRTDAWQLLRTHDVIALSTGFSTKREKVPDYFHASRKTDMADEQLPS